MNMSLQVFMSSLDRAGLTPYISERSKNEHLNNELLIGDLQAMSGKLGNKEVTYKARLKCLDGIGKVKGYRKTNTLRFEDMREVTEVTEVGEVRDHAESTEGNTATTQGRSSRTQ